MIPVLNALNVNIAVFGNHDFGKFQLLSDKTLYLKGISFKVAEHSF